MDDAHGNIIHRIVPGHKNAFVQRIGADWYFWLTDTASHHGVDAAAGPGSSRGNLFLLRIRLFRGTQNIRD